MVNFEINDLEFNLFRKFIYDRAGINLNDNKKSLIISRLSKRLRHYSITTFKQYFEFMIDSGQADEQQMVIDLLTTNETYFFREPKHFDYFKNVILANRTSKKPLKVWSAASSTGEEAYSIAMILDDVMAGKPWDILASDINLSVLKQAQQGHYLQNRIDGIPKPYLHKYCLKGTGEYEGTLLVDKNLRDRVSFSAINLKHSIKNLGLFDIIFLRNVLIYFDIKTKSKIIKNITEHLHPGGYLFIGHSESLKEMDTGLKSVIPALYQKINYQ